MSLYGEENRLSVQSRLDQIQQIERAGHTEDALKSFEILYLQEPDNAAVFHRYKDFCLEHLFFEKAESLIRKRLKEYPGDLDLNSDLGTVLYKMGRREDAEAVWRDMRHQYGESRPVYHILANAYTQERLYDEAVNVYLSGRTRLNQPRLFPLNLANLYSLMLLYDKAAEEYMIYLHDTANGYSLVEKAILRFPRSGSAIRKIRQVILGEMQKSPVDLQVQRLWMRYCIHIGDFEEAFDTARVMERHLENTGKGEALYQYAQQVFSSGRPDLAERAYQIIIDQNPESRYVFRAALELARSLESQEKYREAADKYLAVATRYPDRQWVPEAIYRSGLLLRDRLYRLDQASEMFGQLIRKYPDTPQGRKAVLELADCHLRSGRLKDAEASFKTILAESEQPEGKIIEALVRYAELLFYRGEFNGALNMLKKLGEWQGSQAPMSHHILNDGLNLRLFIQNYRYPEDALRVYARSIMYQKQHRPDTALAALDSLKNGWPDHALMPEILYRKGSILLDQKEDAAALEMFRRLQSEYPGYLKADRALEKAAWIYEQRGDRRRAVETYEKILLDYPGSVLADDIRQRLARMENGQ